MNTIFKITLSFAIFTFTLLSPAIINAQKSCCEKAEAATSGEVKLGEVKIAVLNLVNQDGETVNFNTLIKGKVVALNFIFTTCTTICPPMGANFTSLKKIMDTHIGKDLEMISVSIDPANDTPERLKAWSEKFNPGEGWTLLTGDKSTVDQLLKNLQVFTPLKEDHAPIIMMGIEGEDNWIRTNGLAAPEKLAENLNKYLAENEQNKAIHIKHQQDLSYFSDVELVNQYGEAFHLYSDLMKDKIVFINPFFAQCTGTCPVMHKMMQEVQTHLGDRLDKEVLMLSITVDSKNDTPEKLKAYAEQFGAKPGWHFLSGKPANVEFALQKLGKQVESREAHDTIILIGNLNTRLWKKVNGLADPKEVISILETVLNDEL